MPGGPLSYIASRQLDRGIATLVTGGQAAEASGVTWWTLSGPGPLRPFRLPSRDLQRFLRISCQPCSGNSASQSTTNAFPFSASRGCLTASEGEVPSPTYVRVSAKATALPFPYPLTFTPPNNNNNTNIPTLHKARIDHGEAATTALSLTTQCVTADHVSNIYKERNTLNALKEAFNNPTLTDRWTTGHHCLWYRVRCIGD
ncbi:hypothetical protein QJS04_geneDACA018353 [Acorus gramineus]|uniref:Leucine-rich repeat-containing N-terminal plant-type domain-containing protein n=1 Tax=Acorus gramineus TaxID=55184 RepID=A0AAV9A0T1_ACOGR|nr:hypothetical protein QJS04_geneDACA018353 [Acorus gramineus]